MNQSLLELARVDSKRFRVDWCEFVDRLNEWLRSAPRLISCPATLFLAMFVSIGVPAQRPATYSNPVIAGDFPDPSVIRVGGDYWATATSGGWAPHFLILHSRDLVNWKQVGAVFMKAPTWVKGRLLGP